MRRNAQLTLLLLIAACGSKVERKAVDSTATGAAPGTVAPASAMTGGAMEGMAMTGDANHDFLRMMSDHHKGLIAMAHETMEEGRGTAASRNDAGKMDAQQDEELKKMVTMLDKDYKDPYEPKVVRAHGAMLDTLLTKSGSAYASTFYRLVIQHHREALTLIDAYLPKATRPDLKAMAEQMKRDQTREIAEFTSKATP
ncbi:MAG: DUF305 domain-containing protein [Gemmatimonadota bacterium]